MTIILKPLHWQFMLLLLDFCSYSVPHQILGGTFQVCNDRGSSCICMWLSLGSPSQAMRKALKIQPTEWAKSRLSGQWLLGLLVLPQAGDWVNINRPKVMWACAIIGPATSPQVDSPVHSPHLLHPRYIAQEGERWAGTLNSSICCLSEPRMSNSRGPHQHLFSGCHWVLGVSEGTTSRLWAQGRVVTEKATDVHDRKVSCVISLQLILSPNRFPSLLPQWATEMQTCPSHFPI